MRTRHAHTYYRVSVFLLSQVSQLQEKRAVSFNKMTRHFFKTTRRFQQNEPSVYRERKYAQVHKETGTYFLKNQTVIRP